MADTRNRIIVATNELFRRSGYNGTSLSQISEASEATIGSIYHFFPGGKEALAVEVIAETGALYRELFESIVAESPDTPSGLQAMFDGAAQVLEETDFIDPCPIGTIARESANTSEPLRLAAERAFQSWIDAARDLLTGAGVGEAAAEELAAVFVAMIEGTFVLSRTQRNTDPLQAAGRSVAHLAERAISEAAAAAVGA